MPRKSINELIAQADLDFADNTTGLITPAKLRGWANDFLNSIAPGYGQLTLLSPTVQSLGLTPAILNFTAAADAGAQTVTTLSPGRITRQEKGTSQINFNAVFETTAGRFVTFTLFKNGAATPWKVSGNGAGAGNPVAVSFSALDYADPAAYYDVRASAEAAATNTTLSDVVMIVQVQPVRSFT